MRRTGMTWGTVYSLWYLGAITGSDLDWTIPVQVKEYHTNGEEGGFLWAIVVITLLKGNEAAGLPAELFRAASTELLLPLICKCSESVTTGEYLLRGVAYMLAKNILQRIN